MHSPPVTYVLYVPNVTTEHSLQCTPPAHYIGIGTVSLPTNSRCTNPAVWS